MIINVNDQAGAGAACKRQCANINLPEDALMEIFCRLPTFESVDRCKIVCKRWLNLISEPGFHAQYIAFRSAAYLSDNNTNTNSSNRPAHPHPHVLCIRRYQNMKPFNYPDHTSFTCLDSLLTFLPPYEQGNVDPIVISSWYNDLVLCTNASPEHLKLYICNPRTRQYIQLPPPSNRPLNINFFISAFTWDPYYVFDKQTGQVTLNTTTTTECPQPQYCVCYAAPRSYKSPTLEMEILSSEARGVWVKAELRAPRPFRYVTANSFNPFTYKGMFHFYDFEDIVGFDPCKIIDGVIHGHMIQMPPYDVHNANYYRSVSVEVFGDKLLLAEYRSRKIYPEVDITEVGIEQNTAYAITVWELRNYDTGEWSMKHRINLHDFVSNDSLLTEYIKRGCPNSSLFYMYPDDADIVLLSFSALFVECNVKRKTLKKLGHFRKFFPRVYGLAFPWWPSPLPSSI